MQIVARALLRSGHSQNDLHTTTNIFLTPLADTCTQPFIPAVVGAGGVLASPARAECRRSELTHAEFKSLRGKMDRRRYRGRDLFSAELPETILYLHNVAQIAADVDVDRTATALAAAQGLCVRVRSETR